MAKRGERVDGMLFLLKIALPPVLVGVMSLATRLWGPTVGGLLMGLPWMTGPVLFFLAGDKGEAFGVGASTGIELGVVCLSAYMLAYGVMTALAPWPACLAAAATAFAGTAWLLQGLALDLWAATAAAVASLVLAMLLLPRPRTPAGPMPLPWWDIPARMLVALILVAAIMLTADALGPRLSGIVSTYPVILTVIGAFTHKRWGADAVRRVMRGLAQSLLSFAAFFLVVGLTLPWAGVEGAFLLASVPAAAISVMLLEMSRRRAGARAR
jgi:hypothetical protein